MKTVTLLQSEPDLLAYINSQPVLLSLLYDLDLLPEQTAGDTRSRGVMLMLAVAFKMGMEAGR